MAGTATHLHTVPTPVPTPVPAPVRSRGNHPAGRALRGAAVRPTAVTGVARTSADVLPLRPVLAEVVPLPTRRAVREAGELPAGPGPVRLTRRGRRVLAGLGLGVVLSVAAVVGGVVVDGSDSPALELAGRSSVVVHSGDTLWSIAESLAPDTDPRAVVDALQEVNGLTGASLVPGQVLLLP